MADVILGRLERAEVVLAEEFRDALADADAVVCDRLTVDDTRAARRLRLVQALSAGADDIDHSALPPGCVLCNAAVFGRAIAEWVVMATLALTRDLLRYERSLREGRWLRDLPVERELRGRTLGTIGFGDIGRSVAELARALGVDAIAVTRSPSTVRAEAAGLRWLGALDQLDGLLAESDVAVVCVPLAAETRGLIGARELELLGRDSYLVNVGRGRIVDEEALYEALRDRRIAGAALDVWWRYPEDGEEPVLPSAFPFQELDNVVMTPHVAGRSVGSLQARSELVVAQLERLAAGLPLENVVAVGAAS